jgi:hypothetical protein
MSMASAGDLTRRPYNFRMADRIVCSCVTCPKCGIWVLIRPQNQLSLSKEKSLARCSAAECGKEFVRTKRDSRFRHPATTFRAPSLVSFGTARGGKIALPFPLVTLIGFHI